MTNFLWYFSVVKTCGVSPAYYEFDVMTLKFSDQTSMAYSRYTSINSKNYSPIYWEHEFEPLRLVPFEIVVLHITLLNN